jgi:stress response protein YsnF
MSQTVVGLFKSNDRAQNAKRELVEEGFASQKISVIAGDGADFNTAGSNGSTTSTHAANGDEGIGTKISNWFHSLTGGDEHTDDVNYYADGVTKGGTVLAVSVPDDEADFVADWLRSHGAHNVDENSGVTQDRAASVNTAKTGAKTSIPVVEEELQVGKRQVQRGGVRVYSHVTERPVEANIRLREEHIRVERRPVDRAATEADFEAGRNQSIELTETAEEAVVGKEATERTEKVRDKVRRTDVEVEQTGGRDSDRSFNDYDQDFRSDFQKNYGSTGANYDRYAPAYQYGYQLGNDPQYVSGDWNDVETRARGDWANRGSGSSWDDMKQAVRTGWERTKNKVSGNRNK